MQALVSDQVSDSLDLLVGPSTSKAALKCMVSLQAGLFEDREHVTLVDIQLQSLLTTLVNRSMEYKQKLTF